jgi:hypothetical protein
LQSPYQHYLITFPFAESAATYSAASKEGKTVIDKKNFTWFAKYYRPAPVGVGEKNY